MTVGMLLTVAGCDDNGWDAPVNLPIDKVNTGLPKVEITIPGGGEIQSKEEWLGGVQMTIYDTDGSVNCQGTIEMKGRGNMSWTFPKKSYSLKLSKKKEVLGMPRHKRWCLISNWLDRTMMRNAGVLFDINSRWSLTGYLGDLGYDHSWVKVNNRTVRDNAFRCDIIGNFGLGVVVNLKKK